MNTGSVIKNLISPADGTQYETLSQFIEGEEVKINRVVSPDESEDYEEFRQTETQRLNDIIQNVPKIEKIPLPQFNLPMFQKSLTTTLQGTV